MLNIGRQISTSYNHLDFKEELFMNKKTNYLYYALSNGLFYYSWGSFTCIISVYLAGKGHSATQISFITAATPLFAMIFQPLCGMLADHFNSPKKVAIVSMLLCGITGFLFAYSKNIFLLFMLNGFAQGLLNGVISLTDRLALLSPYSFGSIRVWGSVFYALACQVAGLVYDYISPLANYYIFVIAVLLTIFCFKHIKDENKINKKTDNFSLKEMFFSLLKNKTFIIFVLIFILFQGPQSANSIYMPLFMQYFGGSTAIIGTTLFLNTLFELPIVLLSDRILNKISYRYLLMFACFCSCLRYGWYATYPSTYHIMCVFVFQALTNIIFILVTVKMVNEIVEEKFVNSAYGISSMLAKGLSALLYQFISGIIIDSLGGNIGYSVIYCFYGITTFLGFLIASFCLKK